MATINYNDETVFTIGTGVTTSRPGSGGSSRNVMSKSKNLKIVTGSVSFDSSYPTGGEDLADIWSQFKGGLLQSIIFDQPLSGAQTGKFAKVDKTTKKILLYTNASPAVEVANASDQSAIAALDFIAVGVG